MIVVRTDSSRNKAEDSWLSAVGSLPEVLRPHTSPKYHHTQKFVLECFWYTFFVYIVPVEMIMTELADPE